MKGVYVIMNEANANIIHKVQEVVKKAGTRDLEEICNAYDFSLRYHDLGRRIKAYYIYTPSSGNTGSNFFTLSFDDDDVTAIASAINGQILNGQYYDLQGRKVVAPQKGQLYIHNGKKVLY